MQATRILQSKKTLSALLTIAVLSILALTSVPAAWAYGNAHGAQQEYQLTMSQNCNNRTICVDESGNPTLGGFWAWAVLYTDGTFDATTTGCGHTGGPVLDLAPPYGGASHCNVDGYWNTNFDGVEFYILNETDTCSGFGQGKPTSTFYDYTQPPFSLPDGMDTGVPLVPGHYNYQDIFGTSPPPGVSIQITVVSLIH